MIKTTHSANLLDGKIIDLDDSIQVWEITLGISAVNHTTGRANKPSIKRTFHVAREILEKCGMLPQITTPATTPEKQQESIQDLVLQLLERVGVYPGEGEQ